MIGLACHLSPGRNALALSTCIFLNHDSHACLALAFFKGGIDPSILSKSAHRYLMTLDRRSAVRLQRYFLSSLSLVCSHHLRSAALVSHPWLSTLRLANPLAYACSMDRWSKYFHLSSLS